jgi:hypothetical protein
MTEGGPRSSGSGRATWVYGIAAELDAAALDGLTGVGGQPARAVADGALSAVVGSVDARAFSEQGLEELLADPAALEALARGHHQVVAGVAAAGPVLPLRLATVYRDDDRVRALLAEQRTAFSQTLGWLAERAECGVKAWADPGALGTGRAEREPAGSAAGAPASGAAYLSRRRAQLADRDTRAQRAAEVGAQLHETLTGLAVTGRSHQPQDAQVTGEPGLMVLNGSYLVDASRMPAFGQSARDLVARFPGFRVEVTGPWPPYSFADGPGDQEEQP